MPRPQRIQFAGTLQHIVCRGNDRQALFAEDSDYHKYLSLLDQSREIYGLEVYNYVLMGNFVHLLVTPTEEGALSKVMEHVTKEYAKYFNKKYNRTGHVFEGRFKSYLVQKEKFYFACTRYIDFSPLKDNARLKAEDYPYSGYGQLAFGRRFTFALDQHEIYQGLGETVKERQLAYRTLVVNYQGEAIDPLHMHGAIIGDIAFKRNARKGKKETKNEQ